MREVLPPGDGIHTRIDSNWVAPQASGRSFMIGAASYSSLQVQIKKTMSNGIQGQLSYTWSKCRDLSSAPVTGDTDLNSIAVPLLLQKSARVGACDFDLRQIATGSLIWELPTAQFSCGIARVVTNGGEVGGILTAETGAPFTVTKGHGNDPLGTGSMAIFR